VPQRAVTAPLRIPVSNVFKGGSGATGTGLSGRVESGIVSVGDRLAVLPGDESGVVRSASCDVDAPAGHSDMTSQPSKSTRSASHGRRPARASPSI
jgi:translation elongation factor EF-1alpha